MLRKTGSEAADRLMRHGYAVAMCNLHVILDYPLQAVPSVGSLTSADNAS